MSIYEAYVVMVALLMWALGVTILYVKAELQNRRLFEQLHELQEKRVKDVQFYAERPGADRTAEVEDVGTPDSRAQEAVRELDVEVAFDFLQRKAQEEGRQVSESKLREDAEKLVRRWGMGPQSPNVG